MLWLASTLLHRHTSGTASQAAPHVRRLGGSVVHPATPPHIFHWNYRARGVRPRPRSQGRSVIVGNRTRTDSGVCSDVTNCTTPAPKDATNHFVDLPLQHPRLQALGGRLSAPSAVKAALSQRSPVPFRAAVTPTFPPSLVFLFAVWAWASLTASARTAAAQPAYCLREVIPQRFWAPGHLVDQPSRRNVFYARARSSNSGRRTTPLPVILCCLAMTRPPSAACDKCRLHHVMIACRLHHVMSEVDVS
jgi:hypothetical protein